MKVLFAIFFLFLLSTGEAANLRKLGKTRPRSSSRSEQQEAPSAQSEEEAMLESPKCVDFLAGIEESLKEMIGFGPYAVTNYICNPVERQQVKENVELAEEDVAIAEEGGERQLEDAPGDPCALAWEKMLLESKTKTLKAMRSDSACKKEIREELAEIGEEANTRRLSIWQTIQKLVKVAPAVLTSLGHQTIGKYF